MNEIYLFLKNLEPGYKKMLGEMHRAMVGWREKNPGRPPVAIVRLSRDSFVIGDVESLAGKLNALKNDSARELYAHVMESLTPNTGTIMGFYLTLEYLNQQGRLDVEWRDEAVDPRDGPHPSEQLRSDEPRG